MSNATKVMRRNIAAELDDDADARNERLDVVYRALYDEAKGIPIAPEAITALDVLGDKHEIRKARSSASRAHSAVVKAQQTQGAEAKAKTAQQKLEKQAPELREQIAQLQRQLNALEDAPVQHEKDAEAHERAMKTIRDAAPAFIRKRHTAYREAKVRPLLDKLRPLQQEHRTLNVLLTIDPTDSNYRHIVTGQRDADGEQPWMLRDMHQRVVVDPQEWARHLHSIDAPKRCEQLAEQIDKLTKQVEQAEAEADKLLDYWLNVEAGK